MKGVPCGESVPHCGLGSALDSVATLIGVAPKLHLSSRLLLFIRLQNSDKALTRWVNASTPRVYVGEADCFIALHSKVLKHAGNASHAVDHCDLRYSK